MCLVGSPQTYAIDVFEEHENTTAIAIKHCQTSKKYYSNYGLSHHTIEAFKRVNMFVDSFYTKRNISHDVEDRYVVLDSGAGRGMSTLKLAAKFPNMPVIGIDKSLHRLSSNSKFIDSFDIDAGISKDNLRFGYGSVGVESSPNSDESENLLLVRADLIDFWIMAMEYADWKVHSHYILYPNPYPKSKHLKRRWHGHPVFPYILALGGRLTIRSNWLIYCKEMESAINAIVEADALPKFCSSAGVSVREVEIEDPISHFERKYKLAHVPVFELSVDLKSRSKGDRYKFIFDSQPHLD